jgi:hypothetical protein
MNTYWMKSRSSNQKQKATIKWVVDGSFFFLVFMNVIVYLLQVNGLKKMWCCICVNYVKAMNEPSSYCGVLDGLWRWQAWQDALVDGSKEWACN